LRRIGLSLVKELVSRYGATLDVKDRVKEEYQNGVRFIIKFLLTK
jgi:signal transduction histidine kinase